MTDKVFKNSINLESGEQFSFKLIMDPLFIYLNEYIINDNEDVLYNHFHKSIEYQKDINM